MKAKTLATFFLFVTCWGVPTCFAADTSGEPIVIHRKVYPHESLSKHVTRLYEQADHEMKLQRLASDIRIAETALELQRRRLAIFDKDFGYTRALLITRQESQLAIVRLEEQLKLLRQEKLLALRHRYEQVRHRKLLVAQDAARAPLAE